MEISKDPKTDLPIELWQSIIQRLEPPSLEGLLFSSKKINNVILNLSTYWNDQLKKKYPINCSTSFKDDTMMTSSSRIGGGDQSSSSSSSALQHFYRLKKIEQKWKKKNFHSIHDDAINSTNGVHQNKQHTLFMDVCLKDSKAIALQLENAPNPHSPRTLPICIDLLTQKEIRKLGIQPISGDASVSVALFINVNEILLGKRDGILTLHDLRIQKYKEKSIHFGEVTEIQCVESSQKIATSSFLDKTVALWDKRYLTYPITRYKLPRDSRPTALSFGENNHQLLCGTDKGDLLNLSTEIEEIYKNYARGAGEAINCITSNHNSSIITVGRMNASIEHHHGKKIERIETPHNSIPIRCQFLQEINQTLLAMDDGRLLRFKGTTLVDEKESGMSMLWGLRATEQRCIITSLDVNNPIKEFII